jgi:hypothetical protein
MVPTFDTRKLFCECTAGSLSGHWSKRFAVWVLLAAIHVAPSARGQTPHTPARLQSLVNDAVVQVQLSYRQDPAERQRRHAELGHAVAAWNKSSRSPADNERLGDWLRRAMRASMPGSHEPLPPLPEFASPAAPAEEIPTPTSQSATETRTPPLSAVESKTTVPPTKSNAGENPPKPVAADTPEPPAAKSESAPGIWTSHPAAAELPRDLLEGDPFRDDPVQDKD